jgi:hypothetical protein
MAEIIIKCQICDGEIVVHPKAVGSVSCPNCKQEMKVVIDEPLLRGGEVSACIGCGHDAMYVQKDFNRTIGMVIVGLGIAFSVYFFAKGQPVFAMGSLAATALIDFLAHYLVGEVTVCYSCHAIYRGFPRNPEHEAFDLKKLEKYGGRASRFGP